MNLVKAFPKTALRPAPSAAEGPESWKSEKIASRGFGCCSPAYISISCCCRHRAPFLEQFPVTVVSEYNLTRFWGYGSALYTILLSQSLLSLLPQLFSHLSLSQNPFFSGFFYYAKQNMTFFPTQKSNPWPEQGWGMRACPLPASWPT